MVDISRMKKRYEEEKRGGELWTPEGGYTLVYAHPLCRPDDDFEDTKGLNYIRMVVHHGVGGKNQMIVCLDPKQNPFLKHPEVKKMLKQRNVRIQGETCPVCAELASGGMDDEEADRSRPQTKYLWGITPLFHKDKPTSDWSKLTPRPSVAMFGKTIYDGMMDMYCNAGDISELDAAVLAQVYREGKGKNDTKYKVTADMRTTRTPFQFKGALRDLIMKAVAPGGDCDLFKVAANMTKGTAEAKAAVSGVAVEEVGDDDEGTPAPDDAPVASTDIPDDEHEVAAESSADDGAGEATPDDDGLPDMAAESAAPKAAAKAAPAKAASKAAPAKAAPAKAAPKPASTPASPAEEAPSDGLDELEAQLEAMSKKNK